ncbi:MAG: Calcium-transporting ATPase 1 [Candidatus Lokiarchaeum sp. GC14_75]|nr:MAG: Calcium-transporting ATPase 1 [Candidatus Lokiarchaeum sp. GC14_75]
MPVSKESYYSQQINDLIDYFQTNLDTGLSLSEMEDRYEKYGYNTFPDIKKSLWKIYISPLLNFLILLILITGIIVVILGEGDTQIITFSVVIINSITAIIQQFRAQKALESLREISALKTTVIRDGKEFEIKTRELVPGDIVVLKQGDKVPADGRIIEHMNLSVDEAALTGESEPVEKRTLDLDDKKISIQNQCNMVFMGTYIHTGRGKELVTGTGVETEIGKISQTLNEMGSIEDIPLTRKLNRLGYILGTIVIINLIILIIFKLIVLSSPLSPLEFNQENSIAAISDSIIRAMNIVPVNLPLLSTLVLITGVLKMAQMGVVIKNLSAIESLGRVSIIVSDKTGTITKNEMTVEKFWINEHEYTVTGSGYEGDGQIFNQDNQVSLTDNETFIRFLDAIVLNNNAKLEFEDVKIRLRDKKEKAIRRALGSPTEAALLVLTEKTGLYPYDIKNKYHIIKEFSFNSEIKRMSTICEASEEDEERFVFSKGAPERLLEICSKIEINGTMKELDENFKNLILDIINKRANQGYRILAIAYNKLKISIDSKREDVERNLIFLGFVSIMDPPRLGVRESVEECQTGGIRVIMVTGDHPATAKTIASEMSIYREQDLVATGDQVKNLALEEFNKTTVFARVEPTDKEIIVETYQNQNLITAMTGDGINDSPALKLANAGIAMGITGTDLAKETSDMVITDDNFSSIVEGVRTGRGIFSKIRTIIFFFICINIMEGILYFTFEVLEPFIGFRLFANNWQHIYIFAILHSLPSIALVIDSHPKDVMKEPPRNEEQLLNKNLWILLLAQAALGGIGISLALVLPLNSIVPLNMWNTHPSLSYIAGATVPELVQMKARTMFITTIYIFEAFFIWTFRRPNKSAYKSIKEEMKFSLLFICLFTLGIHVLFVLFSSSVNTVINDSLGLELNFLFLSFEDWLICFSLAMPGLLGVEIIKYIARKKNILF